MGVTGTGEGEFDQPWDIATDDAGQVYVVDSGNDRIQIFDQNGVFVSQWGQSGSGGGQLDSPAGLFLKTSGEMFLADSGNDRIQRLWASSGNYISQAGQLDNPANPYYDHQFDQLVVADTDNDHVKFFQLFSHGDLSTKDMIYADEINEVRNISPSALSDPHSVVTVSDETRQIIFIADTGNNRVLKVEKLCGSPLYVWEAFKAALQADDLDRALSFIADTSRENYTIILTTLRPRFSTMVAGMGDMALCSLEPNIASLRNGS